MDGSSIQFVETLKTAGTDEQSTSDFLVQEPLYREAGMLKVQRYRWMTTGTVMIDYNPGIRQSTCFHNKHPPVRKRSASCRTFAFA